MIVLTNSPAADLGEHPAGDINPNHPSPSPAGQLALTDWLADLPEWQRRRMQETW